MEEWYEELDFEENPFSTNPSDFVKNIVGRDEIIDDLIYRVRAGSLVFLEGSEGSGKSALLRVLIRKFRGKGKVIYVNCDKLESDLNIEDLLIQRNGFLKGMLMKQNPKNMILLLDNVPKLSHKNMERIKYFFDENFLKSVIFTGENFKDVDFSKSLIQRIEGRVLIIPPLESYQAVDLVRERIGDLKFISDELIEQIAELSNYNPKQILKALEEVSEYVVSVDEDVIEAKHIEQVLGKTLKSSKEEKDVPKDVSKGTKQDNEKQDDTDEDIKHSESKILVEDETSDVPLEVKEKESEKEKESLKSDNTEVSDNVEAEEIAEAEEVKEDIEKVSEDIEEVEEVSEDVIKKPIIAEETDASSDSKDATEDDDDFFADDFFDEDEDTKKSKSKNSKNDDEEEDEKKKKSSEESFEEYDDFFDDDFDK